MAKQITKPTVFVLTRRKIRPALAGRHYPGYFRMPSVEEILDEKTNKVRTIRYALGESSIFKDEQSEKVTLGDIIFVNGTLTLDRMNPNLLAYMSLSNHNEGNEARNPSKTVFFRKLDPAGSAKIDVDIIIEETKAVSLALGMEFSKLVGYAKIVGIDTNREVSEIRHDMVLFAKKNPKLFMNGVDDPKVARQTVIGKAREMGIVKFEGRSVKWNTGTSTAPILTVPVGMKVAEYFAEWTIREKEGGEVFDEIERLVNKPNEK